MSENESEKPFGVMLDLTKAEKLDLDVALSAVSKDVGRKITNRELFTAFVKSFITNPAETAKKINL